MGCNRITYQRVKWFLSEVVSLSQYYAIEANRYTRLFINNRLILWHTGQIWVRSTTKIRSSVALEYSGKLVSILITEWTENLILEDWFQFRFQVCILRHGVPMQAHLCVKTLEITLIPSLSSLSTRSLSNLQMQHCAAVSIVHCARRRRFWTFRNAEIPERTFFLYYSSD